MPIPVLCPGCSARLNAPDAAAGKTVKCPKCGDAMIIPEADPPAPKAKPPAPPAKKPMKAAVVADDDEDDKPRKKKKRVVDDDDDDDDRPRKKKKKAEGGTDTTRTIVGIVALVITFSFAGFIWYNRMKAQDDNDPDKPPAEVKKR